MRFDELIQLYFNRSNALQWYWTLYVVIIGGLLAFSSLRQRKDLLTTALVTILYLCFAHKNAGAIGDATNERFAILQAIKDSSSSDSAIKRIQDPIIATLNPPPWEGTRYFHLACDALTVAAVWAMELRRRKAASAANAIA